MESADKYAKDLQHDVNVKSVNAIKTQPQKVDTVCYRCGGAMSCPFKEAECYACRKKGHIAKMCRSKPKATQQRVPQNSEKTHKVDVHDPDAEGHELDATEYRLFTVSSQENASLVIEFEINGDGVGYRGIHLFDK